MKIYLPGAAVFNKLHKKHPKWAESFLHKSSLTINNYTFWPHVIGLFYNDKIKYNDNFIFNHCKNLAQILNSNLI